MPAASPQPAPAAAVPPFQIDADFAGGNIRVDRIEGDTVDLQPDLRDTEGNWFYWCFRVRGAAGRTLTFRFTRQSPLGVRGPAVSTDEGATWQWLGRRDVTNDSFVYRFAADAGAVRFSFGMTYTQAHWERFLASLPPGAAVRTAVLTRSRRGRAVEQLFVGAPTGTPRVRLLLTARHHACEMMADYALEGFVLAALADDELGQWYRRNVQAALVPFADKDGAEDGDQGKNRRPHDHNRDYGPAPLYPEVQALQAFAATWSEGRLAGFVDVHCPWIRGTHNEWIYQVGRQDPAGWAEQQRLGRHLEACRRGPLPYLAADDLPFGQAWNTTTNYSAGMSAASWFSLQPGVRFSTSIELPYANARGVDVTAESARAFGRDLAAGLRAYLEAERL